MPAHLNTRSSQAYDYDSPRANVSVDPESMVKSVLGRSWLQDCIRKTITSIWSMRFSAF